MFAEGEEGGNKKAAALIIQRLADRCKMMERRQTLRPLPERHKKSLVLERTPVKR